MKKMLHLKLRDVVEKCILCILDILIMKMVDTLEQNNNCKKLCYSNVNSACSSLPYSGGLKIQNMNTNAHGVWSWREVNPRPSATTNFRDHCAIANMYSFFCINYREASIFLIKSILRYITNRLQRDIQILISASNG